MVVMRDALSDMYRATPLLTKSSKGKSASMRAPRMLRACGFSSPIVSSCSASGIGAPSTRQRGLFQSLSKQVFRKAKALQQDSPSARRINLCVAGT